MRSILDELYHGNVRPVEQIVSNDSSYWTIGRSITEQLHKWRERLSADDYARLEHLLDLRAQAGALDQSAAFAHGFQLGAALMIEVLVRRGDAVKAVE